jgi:hypothetical protein
MTEQPYTNTPLDQLRKDLETTGRSYEVGDLAVKREAVVDALLAVVKYLEAQGFSPASLKPLARPARALTKIESKSGDELFAKPRQSGRPSTTLNSHERTGILAALANFWLLTHQGEDNLIPTQLREVTRQMKGRWFGNITDSQLKTARETVSQESNDHIAVQYAQFTTDWLGTFQPEKAFASVVAYLNEQGLPLGVGEPES